MFPAVNAMLYRSGGVYVSGRVETRTAMSIKALDLLVCNQSRLREDHEEVFRHMCTSWELAGGDMSIHTYSY